MLNTISGLLGGALPTVVGDYESIATVNVTSSQSFIDFTVIPSTYKHLQIRGILLNASGQQNLAVRFNSDTGSNYFGHQLQGDGSSTPAAGNATTQTFIPLMGLVTNTSSYPFATVIDILDYQSTTKNKTIRSLSGQDGNATGTPTNWRVQLSSGAWANSSNAINAISLWLPSYTIGQYSHFALYGIKG